jgi:S-sulfo-L-cysteine synthase (O-acetyl-L-serine-dependent)
MATNFQNPREPLSRVPLRAGFSALSKPEPVESINSTTQAQPVDVLSLIGNTPLLRLNRIGRDYPGVEIYAKAEWFNPGGSVKDRPALNIIREAERAGLMSKQKVLVDSTSGNTGIAYAMICAARGYSLKLFMPANVSPERKRILHAYGTEVVYTDPLEGSDGSIRAVRELVRQDSGRYFYANQYDNPANWQAHYQSTGPEIFAQTAGRVTHFVAGLGTSGTFTGTARRLKELNPAIRCISAQPDSSFHGLEGLKHMPSAIWPGIYDPSLADRNLEISTEEGHAMTRRLAREEGLLVGISSGAAMGAALRVARDISRGVVVTVFCDSGDKYLSERFWD